MSDILEISKAVDSFQADTIGQHLDKMAATIILDKPKSDMGNIALKLSMSHIVDCMNTKTMAIFQKISEQGSVVVNLTNLTNYLICWIKHQVTTVI
ncbi:hypothetical protein DFQ28_010591 [Apophysomyces sp. BC1034]|nr:hypothetical protein DFQ29_002544 [Apophysomyces sp. BC1021]KAG0194507.1 hypothetical protein DFQ28_010591 [Apophysomyces sp. BC1034]